MSCDEQEDTREDVNFPSSKELSKWRKEASEDGSGAWTIVSGRRVNNVLHLVLIGPPYCVTFRKTRLKLSLFPSRSGISKHDGQSNGKCCGRCRILGRMKTM